MPPTKSTVAVVTGCSSGIGEALALELASRGIVVVATARQVESLAHLTKKFDNILPLALELEDVASLERFRDAVAEQTGGRVDILINNAGTHYAATAEDLEIEEAQKLFAVNVFSVMRLCQLFLPMLRQSSSGRIVQIGSVVRGVPVPWQCVYNASKAALSQYTKTLRLEVKPFGIEVIEVVTGYVKSNILHNGLYAPERSLYLPVKHHIERLKNEGNQTGMLPDAFAKSVVSSILAKRPKSEVWQGRKAWVLWFILNVLPLWLSNLIFYRKFNLVKLTEVSKRLKGY